MRLLQRRQGTRLRRNYDDWFEGKNRPAFRKFMPAYHEGLNNDFCAHQHPFDALRQRIADVKAEVLNEQGHPEQAIPLINEIRRACTATCS